MKAMLVGVDEDTIRDIEDVAKSVGALLSFIGAGAALIVALSKASS